MEKFADFAIFPVEICTFCTRSISILCELGTARPLRLNTETKNRLIENTASRRNYSNYRKEFPMLHAQ